MYLAPAYFIFLLTNYVIKDSVFTWIERLSKLGLIVLGVSAVSLGPFWVNGTLWSLFQRLFPFRRGLVHAYWAPNGWSLYVGLDRILAKVFLGSAPASATRGLVENTQFAIFPEITPAATFIITLIVILVLFHINVRWD